MSDDLSVNSVQAKDVYGVAGDNQGTINQYFVSQESEVRIKGRPLIKGSPYLGLEKFAPDDKDKFFGRERWITDLSHYLLAENNNVLLLLGASGSGKSSLIGAGLIPKLKDDWGAFRNLTFVPDENPFKSLHNCLSMLCGQAKAAIAQPDNQTDKTELLVRVVQSLKQEQQWLLFIDQFEELFTRTPKTERDQFVASLVQLIQTYEHDRSLKIVMTMRADFLDRLSPYPGLGMIHDRYSRMLTDMSEAELTLAIKEPAARNGVVFEPGLVDEIIADFRKQAGSLPLLQYTLDLLWKNDDVTDQVLNQRTYTNLGGVMGALQQQADRIYNRLSAAEQAVARQILLAVVTLEKAEAVSRRTDKAQFLPDQTQADVLEQLIQARLLVVRGEQAQATVEVAHEALLRNWDVIQELVRENKEIILLRERLHADAEQWQARTMSNPETARDELWSGSKLERVLELKKAGSLEDFNSTVQAFITASTEWSDLQLVKEQEKSARLQQALNQVTLREQANRVLNWLPAKPLESVVLAIQTLGLNLEQMPEPLSIVQTGVQQAMEKGRVPTRIFQGHEAAVTSIAFSPNDQMIVSGSHDGTIRLWDLQGNLIGLPFRAYEERITSHEGRYVRRLDSVNSVAFSPNGQMIVSSDDNRRIWLWDLQGNLIAQSFWGHNEGVSSVAFSPDGQTIVSGSYDKTIRLWNLQGNPIGQPSEGTRPVWCIAFSPDGQMIASGGFDNTICLRYLQGNPIGQPFRGHENSINSIAFSPDGQMIISSSWDKTIRLWDLQGNPIGQPFQGHSGYIRSVAFSPDGRTIISGSDDNTIRLWDLQGNPIGQPLQGHQRPVSSVVFSSDGQTIVSGSWDHTICLWDLQGNSIRQPFEGHENYVNSVACSPNGQMIVSGGNQNIRLWDLQGNPIGQPFQGHEGSVSSVSFSPDGKTIAIGSGDKTIRLWDLQGNPIGQPFRGHEDRVTSVAFSPDGKTLVSGSDDSTIRLWDLQGNPIGQPFRGHADRLTSTHVTPDDTVNIVYLDGIHSVAFSPDYQTIVSGSYDKTLRLWDLQGNPIGQPFQGHEDCVTSVAFSPDGTRIVSGSDDKTLQLWDLQGNLIGLPFQGHEDRVTSVAFAPDGQTIVSGSWDKTIRLWDLQGNLIGQPFQGHQGRVTSVAFASDGKTIVSGGDDGTIRLWRGHWQAWLEVCCERLRYHPVFSKPNQVFRDPEMIRTAEVACETCRQYVWEPQMKAQAQLESATPVVETSDTAMTLTPALLNTYLQQGVEFVQAKEYRAALQKFDSVIGARSDYPRAYHGRGYCHAQLGNSSAAIADLQQAAQLYQTMGQNKQHEQVTDLLQKLHRSFNTQKL